VRARCPGVIVVLGGPHPHIYPEETAGLPGVDYVVIGEGERTLVELLDRLGDSEGLRQCPGLVYRAADGEVVSTGTRPLLQAMDELPLPARHLTPYERYSSVMAKRHPVTTMFTSRGCPYRCTFCDRPNLGKAFRARSAGSVVDEMAACVDLGIHEFLIYDDTFTVDRKRVLAICDEIERRGLDIGWDFRARTNTVDLEMLQRLRRAGCERIHYGVEVPNDRLMKVLRKGLKIDSVVEAFRATHRAGIETLAYFMIGVPTQTREEIHETFRFMRRLAPGYVHLTVLTPFPATHIYEEGLREGIIERDYWREYARAPHPGFIPPPWPGEVPLEELHQLILRGYRSFYLRPSYVARKLVRVRSLGELRRKAHAGLNILRMRAFGGGRDPGCPED
jgi:radical SAM superfamily enzyme YgiQ (UPF0313 family)